MQSRCQSTTARKHWTGRFGDGLGLRENGVGSDGDCQGTKPRRLCVPKGACLGYTEIALCVSPNALCSTTFSISCSQSRAQSVTLLFSSADVEGHVRDVGPA